MGDSNPLSIFYDLKKKKTKTTIVVFDQENT